MCLKGRVPLTGSRTPTQEAALNFEDSLAKPVAEIVR